MFPELFKIPGLGIPLSTYGLLVSLGVIAAILLSERLSVKDGLPRGKAYDLGLWMVISSFIGAKLLMIFTDWDESGGLWQWITSMYFWRSTGVFFGGLVCALVLSVILIRKWRLPWGKTSDAFAPGIALGHAIGRMGCFAAGCCWGKPTSSWFGVTFTQRAFEITGVPYEMKLIPIQLIEALVNLLIFGALMRLRKYRKFDGQIILTYIILYSTARFIIEFWRGDPRGQILGISTSQFIAVVMFPLAIAASFLLYKRQKRSAASS